MPKKTTILIAVLVVITGVLIFLAIRSDKGQNLLTNTQAEVTTTPTQPFASLTFLNSVLDATAGQSSYSIDVIIDTFGRPAAGAQLELSYDPTILTNVTVSAPVSSFFGPSPSVLINSVDPAQGRISYAVGISATDEEKVGKGAVATINFKVNRAAGIPSTEITFLPKSAVSTFSSQGSVLSSTTPLQVKILPTSTQ